MTEKKLHECKLCGAIDSESNIYPMGLGGLGEFDGRTLGRYYPFYYCTRCGNMRMKIEEENG
jgi:hypothetical protein